MSSEEWPSKLVEMLYTGEESHNIVDFIQNSVPKDETHIFDNKQEVYVTSSESTEQKKRRAQLAKTIAGLANVHHRSQYRFIFVGFDDSGRFVGIQYYGDNGGTHLYDADDQALQNILRDHLEPPPSVEKHRLNDDGKQGLVIVIEPVPSPPIVLTKTVRVGGNRITTQGIAPTRRGSETTHMRHSDFRDIVEHREDSLKQSFQQWVDELAVIDSSVDEDESSDESQSDDQEGSSSKAGGPQRIGPTVGLQPEQKKIQNELIEIAFKEFTDKPFAFTLTYQAPRLISEVIERTNADEDAVQTVWKFCRDDEFFRKRGNSWRITPKAVFRAEELGLDVALNDALQEEILDTFLQAYQSDPHHPMVGEEDITKSMGQPRNEILQNLWFLSEKGYIEREAYIGGDAVYQITDHGRRYLE